MREEDVMVHHKESYPRYSIITAAYEKENRVVSSGSFDLCAIVAYRYFSIGDLREISLLFTTESHNN